MMSRDVLSVVKSFEWCCYPSHHKPLGLSLKFSNLIISWNHYKTRTEKMFNLVQIKKSMQNNDNKKIYM